MRLDTQIKRNVEEELRWDPNIDVNDIIGVAVKDGIVTLTGFVRRYNDIFEAEGAAKHVAGVIGVVNDLELRLPGEDERPDTDIANDAIAMLKIHLRDAAEHIKVSVSNGWVTLEGHVQWNHQRTAAENAVRFLKGVKGVDNLIGLQPQGVPVDIKRKIEDAFERSADIDAKRITVAANGGDVVLKGTVPSWAKREKAERIAWAAPGVVSVDNRITMAESE
jgi:osmotically-inducible protein OsmY